MRGSYQRVGPTRTKVTSAPTPVRTPTPARRQHIFQPWQLPSQLTFYVHAHGPTVRQNKATGQNYPLILVRRSDRLGEMVIARHVEIPGPSRLVHRHSMPLPETEQNAIAVMETTAVPIAYFDPPGDDLPAYEVPLSSCIRTPLTDEEWDRRAQKATHFIKRA